MSSKIFPDDPLDPVAINSAPGIFFAYHNAQS
jgi:hypothetical protein